MATSPYVNGFTADGAASALAGFQTAFPKFNPAGTVTSEANGTQTWGYGKQVATGLATPQTYSAAITGTQFLIDADSNEFQIDLGGNTNIVVNAMQFLDNSNTVGLEVATGSTAEYIYNGAFTLLSGSKFLLSPSAVANEFYDL